MKVIIVGATSGLGYGLAKMYLEAGAQIGVAGRRVERLDALKAISPERVTIARIDVSEANSEAALTQLIEKVGGMDVYINAAGYGSNNEDLEMDIELASFQVNALGFVRMVGTAYNYFKSVGGGHIAIISSIAGTKGLGPAAAYSSTKKMQSTYIQALTQISRTKRLNISFTDIKPGFVDTDFINASKYFMVMQPEPVVKTMYKAINKKKRVVIIDWKFRILVGIWNLIPRFLWERLPLCSRKA